MDHLTTKGWINPNLMEEDSWDLRKNAFSGSKDHSLVVIPADDLRE